MVPLPYCGTPPSPGELWARFNLDPVLIAALVLAAAGHLRALASSPGLRKFAAAGWLTAAAALISPLCALSVSLFSARIGQHMVLMLVAAPLIALGAPPRAGARIGRPGRAWLTAAAFMAALWCWHMPRPYDATFASTPVYWTMHLTLFGSAALLWRELIWHDPRHSAAALSAGLFSSTQMGMLGAVLCFAQRPLFFPHLFTTQAWGLTPLQDQQLGGTLMWVPGIALFLWVTIRSIMRTWTSLEGTKLQGTSRNEHSTRVS